MTRAPTLPQHWKVCAVQRAGAPKRSRAAQVESIAVGDEHACLIARDTRVRAAAGGNGTSLAAVSGNVTCWGNDKFGRCVVIVMMMMMIIIIILILIIIIIILIILTTTPSTTTRVSGSYPDGAEYVGGLFPANLQGRFSQVRPSSRHLSPLSLALMFPLSFFCVFFVLLILPPPLPCRCVPRRRTPALWTTLAQYGAGAATRSTGPRCMT